MTERPLGLLSEDEVAEMFGISTLTVQRYARAGELPRVKFGGRWWFPRDEMADHLRARVQPVRSKTDSRLPNASEIQRWTSGEKGVL